LTRGSIFFARLFSKRMDCRVKPGNDGEELAQSRSPCRRGFPSPRQSTCSLPHGTRPTTDALCRCETSSINGGSYAFQVYSRCQRSRCDAGGHGGMGAKHDERADTRSHHAKDTAGEEHRTGSIRIRARPPQAQIPLAISISIHAEPSKDAIDHRHALTRERVIHYPASGAGSFAGGSIWNVAAVMQVIENAPTAATSVTRLSSPIVFSAAA